MTKDISRHGCRGIKSPRHCLCRKFMKKIKVLRFYLYDFIRENAFFVAPYIQEKACCYAGFFLDRHEAAVYNVTLTTSFVLVRCDGSSWKVTKPL